jgi:hypothetical protein
MLDQSMLPHTIFNCALYVINVLLRQKEPELLEYGIIFIQDFASSHQLDMETSPQA